MPGRYKLVGRHWCPVREMWDARTLSYHEDLEVVRTAVKEHLLGHLFCVYEIWDTQADPPRRLGHLPEVDAH